MNNGIPVIRNNQGDSARTAVIIVTWNAAVTIESCLHCLSRQIQRPDRVIIVDNHSSDETCDIVRNTMPDAELHELDKNTGFAAGNNYAINLADDCENIVLLNPDAYARSDWLEKLLTAADENPQHGMFASLMFDANSGNLDGAGDIYHRTGLAWRRFHSFNPGRVSLEQEEVFGPCAAAALYRRSALEDVGLFDESFFCYFEDVDLAFRMQLRGHSCLFVPNAIVDHVGSAATAKASPFTVYHGYRNLQWCFVKNMPWPRILWLLPLHISMLLATTVGYIVRGNGKAILRARWHALKGLGRALRQRRQIQAGKTVDNDKLNSMMDKGSFISILRGKNILK
jgi:GT2 family glycosyltransferase